MANPHIIKTPRGSIIVNAAGKAELKWNPGFGQKYTYRFGKLQTLLDKKVYDGMEPYTPLRTGMLIKSVMLVTTFGSGTIRYFTPYDRKQYYRGRLDGSSTTGGLRGRFWFERYKIANKNNLLRFAKSFMRSQSNG